MRLCLVHRPKSRGGLGPGGMGVALELPSGESRKGVGMGSQSAVAFESLAFEDPGCLCLLSF